MLSQRDASTLLLPGDRSTGLDVRAQNVNAALSLANIVKTSLGPLGLDKMMVDDIGEVTITNDGASILKLLEVKHPAAKVLVDLAHQQDEEVGDGTTSVVIIAAELLKRAQDLIVNGLHPTTIITGYRIACKEAVKFIKEHMTVQQQQLTVDDLMAIAKTSMASKILNFHGDYFANMTVNAIKAVEIQVQGKLKYPVNSVNVLKSHGKSAKESIYVDGYALNCTMASQAMPRSIQNAKILCLDMNLQKQRMQMTVQIVIDDPDQIEAIRKRELDITSERISKILATGANVILTTKGIDDMCINYFVDHKTIAVRRVLKEDLKRIAKCTGATILNTLSDLEGNEVIDNSALGYADQVVQERVGDEEVILIKKPKKTPAASIILRGANDFMLEEMERSLHDALCAVRRAMESSSVVPGGGCIEGGVSVFLERFAPTLVTTILT